MTMFGSSWKDEDGYDGSMLFRHWKDEFEYPKNDDTIKSKTKLSNNEVVKILKSRSKKDLNLILKMLNK